MPNPQPPNPTPPTPHDLQQHILTTGETIEQTATRYNLTTQQTVRLIARAEAEAPNPTLRELRTLAIAEQTALAILEAQTHITQKGDIVTGIDARTSLAAAEALARISQTRRRLLGLDQPARKEVQTEATYRIIGVDPSDLT